MLEKNDTNLWALLLLGVSLLLSTPVFSATGSAPLSVVKVVYAQVKKHRALDGVIEAVNQATISAQTTGRVKKINADVDDYVNKGDILVTFRDKKQRSAFNAANANFNEAEKEYQRVKDIYEKKLIAKAVLDKAEARFKSARASLAEAKEALEDTVVRAPYSGIVVKRHIQVGELAQPGRALMTGLSLEALRVRVNVPQNVIHAVRQFSAASVVFRQSKESVNVTSMRISPYADSQSHSFEVKANLPEGDYGTYPGMYAKVYFVTGEDKRLVIPLQAITHRSEVSAVYVKDTKGQLHYRQVRAGMKIPQTQNIEILSGLSEGEEVILEPVTAAARLKQQEAE